MTTKLNILETLLAQLPVLRSEEYMAAAVEAATIKGRVRIRARRNLLGEEIAVEEERAVLRARKTAKTVESPSETPVVSGAISSKRPRKGLGKEVSA